VTYVVVVFSILVQGLTIGPFARRWLAASDVAAAKRITVSSASAPASSGA
jgi:NhaP-type Na+/H+ or K+/H+ antiporter